MLQDKYLALYQFSEKHTLVIQKPARQVWPLLAQMDFRKVTLIRILFALRGMPARMMNLEGLQRSRFVLLEQIENKELIFGLIGQFWRPSGNLQKFQAAEFLLFPSVGFAKATWSFELVPTADGTVEVTTETRIWCSTDKVLRKFQRYWFIVRPFSGIIRKELLKHIKKQAEAAGNT